MSNIAVLIGKAGEPLLQSQAHLRDMFEKARRENNSSTVLPTAMANGLPPNVDPCVPGVMVWPTASVVEARANWESRRRALWPRP